MDFRSLCNGEDLKNVREGKNGAWSRYSRSLQAFSAKGQIVNIFVFTGHMVFVAMTQLCHCHVKAAMGNM